MTFSTYSSTFIILFKNVFKYLNISEWLEVGIFIFELLIINWYLFKALNKPSLFRNIDSKLKLVKEIISDKKNESLAVNSDMYDENLFRLKNYMIEKKHLLILL